MYAIIARGDGVGRDRAMLEAHRKYLDIQYVIEGVDTIGWLEREFVERVKQPYDSEKTSNSFMIDQRVGFRCQAVSFAVFLPQDVHASLATTEYAHKAVVKVKFP